MNRTALICLVVVLVCVALYTVVFAIESNAEEAPAQEHWINPVPPPGTGWQMLLQLQF